ncbi:pirin family protein [Teredinibacter turnerae]|uniref:pirin family protein n=1 Tax=Teredinibacter turnerae TaxID=2426 RepID=UPI0003770FC3|nr:pirin-like bicupin family protein [Teredinibacter turnerae]
MIVKRAAEERGPSDLGWLQSQHTFSFGGYQDPAHMGFGPLRVINEDRVVPGAGFGTHPHKNMEIISYVLSGELAHKDSMGNGSRIVAGDVQVMSAGAGVTHSEFNASDSEFVHFLQIWIQPNAVDTEPGYQQLSFAPEDLRNKLIQVVGGDARAPLQIKQDASLAIGRLEPGVELGENLVPTRKYWLQVASGELRVNGELAKAGDGLAIAGEAALALAAITEAEILLFDLPA